MNLLVDAILSAYNAGAIMKVEMFSRLRAIGAYASVPEEHLREFEAWDESHPKYVSVQPGSFIVKSR